MSNYNSENTTVLAIHEQTDGNTRMLLLRIRDDGTHEYVIGSHFTEKWDERWLHDDYEWDWGNYFNGEEGLLNAVDYWRCEVLGGESAKKQWVEGAWKRFGDTPVDNTDRLDEPFWMKPGKSYPRGTDRFEIWHDFDELYADWGGVHALAYPDDRQ